MPTRQAHHKSKQIESFVTMTNAFLVLLDRTLEHLSLNAMKDLREKVNQVLDEKINNWETTINRFIKGRK